MKKTILTSLILASGIATSLYALPVYEPFTEYASQIVPFPTGTNAIDLATGGYTAPSGESWAEIAYSAKSGFGTGAAACDILVTNLGAVSTFTSNNLQTLLPNTFPGFPGFGQAITVVLANPAPATSGNNYCGNSAELVFANDITRQSTNRTLYISYLVAFCQKGQLGAGNDGRYLDFISSSNLSLPNTSFPTWISFFNKIGGGQAAPLPNFASHGLIEISTSSAYIGACDNSLGKEFDAGFTVALSPSGTAPAAPDFIVGRFTLVPASATNSGINDTNSMYANPPISSFGGAAPAASSWQNDLVPYTTTNWAVSDLNALVIEDRIGSSTTGGVGSNYMANLIIGSTWQFVTGGVEFTAGPGNISQPPNSTITLSATAMAAGQTVGSTWQKVTPTTTNTVTAGAGGAGGAATVSFATNGNMNTGLTLSMTLTGISFGDAGSYQVVGTASSTGYTNTSSVGTLTVSDPAITVQPQSTSGNYGGTVSFSATAVTGTGQLNYAWYNGSTMLVNGTLPDGTSTGSSAMGTLSANSGTFTLNLSGISYLDASTAYTLVVTNGNGGVATSSPASLAVTDPYIVTQPPAIVEIASGGSGTIPVSAIGSGVTYQWNWNNGNGFDVNNGEISGATTSALTINPATVADEGTYTVGVGGASGQTPTTTAAVVYIDTAPTSVSIFPAQWTQAVGTHLAIVGTNMGGSGIFNYIWKKNGTIITGNGQQADGSFVFGQNAKLIGTNVGVLVLSNLQTSDTGTYTLISSNAAGQVASGNCVITVEPPGYLTLSSNNLIVTRVGDGAQPLSGATGNTLYLDQYTITGTYSNTIMAPDSGPNAIVVAGGPYSGGNEGAQEAYLTLSSNQEYLNFGGFCFSYPYTAGNNVTVGGAADVRGIYALNASGTLALVYTNYGLYSGGNGFRSVYSTDGLTNFWTTGSASGGTVKYVNSGPAGASYTITTPGQGIQGLPGVTAPSPNSGGVVVGLYGTNIVFSDNSTDGDTTVPDVWGLDAFTNTGAPEVAPAGYTNLFTFGGEESHPCDFSFSPDLQTVYVADDDTFTVTNTAIAPNNTNFGGIQRWDYYTVSPNTYPTWNFTYLIQEATGSGTNGCRGLTVYWPTSTSSWGAGANGQTPVAGAVLYATTSESSGNRIVQIVDNGGTANVGSGLANNPPATETVLVTAPPNQFYRGIRFGPIVPQVAVTASVVTSPAVAGQPVEFTANVSGVFAYFFPNAAGTAYNFINTTPTSYQWYTNGTQIPNATNITYDIPSVATTNAASYSFVVTTGAPPTSYTNSVALAVNAFNPNSTALVGWWKLSDGSGTNAADSSTYGDTGAIWVSNSLPNPPGTPDWVNGLGGTFALDLTNFDGNYPTADTNNNDNVVLIPDAAQLNFTNTLAFTLAAWVQNATNNQVSGAPLIAKGYGSGGEQYTLDLYNNNPNIYRFYVRNASGTATLIYDTNYIPNTNGWDHVAATYDGNAGVMAVYINGQLSTNITTGVPTSLLSNSWPVSIGNRTSGLTNASGIPIPYDFPFFGTMQDVRIYNVSLGLQDIQAIYNQLAPPGILVFSNSLALVVDNQAAPVNFGAIPQYAAVSDDVITFEVTNTGPVALTLGTVTAPSGYAVTAQPSSTVAPGGTTTFSVQFTATSVGTYSGTVSFSDNVPLFSPFSFPVTGVFAATPAPVWAATPVTGAPGAPVLNFSGTAGTTYHLWSTTNVALEPVETKWTSLGTGTFSGGADTFNAPAGAPGSATFYAITQP